MLAQRQELMVDIKHYKMNQIFTEFEEEFDSCTSQFDTGLDGLNYLDVCCGMGGGINFMRSNYPLSLSVGVDYSPQQIRLANMKYPSSDLLKFAVGDAQNLMGVDQIKDLFESSDFAGFDLISCIEGLIYMSDIRQFF